VAEIPVERAPRARVRPRDRSTPSDRVFSGLTRGAGVLVLVILTLIAVFLVDQAGPALSASGWSFFTTVDFASNLRPPVLGVLGLLIGTVTVALIAVTVAIPTSVLTALFITDVATGRLRAMMMGLVDQGAPLISSYAIAGLVVSLMTLPIITSIVREVFMQVPPGEKEAALALGSTRWGMLRTVVLPFGRGGIIGGSMLGLGRALGETIAVSLLLPQIPSATVHILQYGGSTIAGFIANNTGVSGLALSGLLAAGLVLFVFTLATNFIASLIISRSRSGAGVDA
jgi:phosphate transport system permease protein